MATFVRFGTRAYSMVWTLRRETTAPAMGWSGREPSRRRSFKSQEDDGASFHRSELHFGSPYRLRQGSGGARSICRTMEPGASRAKNADERATGGAHDGILLPAGLCAARCPGSLNPSAPQIASLLLARSKGADDVQHFGKLAFERANYRRAVCRIAVLPSTRAVRSMQLKHGNFARVQLDNPAGR